jgi:hypothetical protein
MCFLRLAADNYLECRSLLLLIDSKLLHSRKQKQGDSCRPAFSIGEILFLKQNHAWVKFDA